MQPNTPHISKSFFMASCSVCLSLKSVNCTFCLLPGITREVVIELAKQEGLTVHEVPIPPDALLAADEAFLTGSLKEITPLVSVNGSRIRAGSPGPVTRLLQTRY